MRMNPNSSIELEARKHGWGWGVRDKPQTKVIDFWEERSRSGGIRERAQPKVIN